MKECTKPPLIGLLALALVSLFGCSTPEDPADEEFYFAEAASEKSLAVSYLKRAQFAREKQVEYLELAETQEELLKQLRQEIAQKRAANNKRAQQVEGLKKEAAALEGAVKVANDAKAKSAASKKKLDDEKKALDGSIVKLQAEIKALKEKKATLEAERKSLEEAFGISKGEEKK